MSRVLKRREDLQLRVLVTGSRNWTDVSLIEVVLESVLRQSRLPPERITVIHGDCPYGGADLIAATVAEGMGMKVEAHPADWDNLGKKAGPIRNQEMVDSDPDICLAFPMPDSVGTVDCVKRARKADVPVQVTEAFR